MPILLQLPLMPRKKDKYTVMVWVCTEDGGQLPGGLYLNTRKHGKRIERRKYNPRLRKHTMHFTRPEKSGSLGLARNK